MHDYSTEQLATELAKVGLAESVTDTHRSIINMACGALLTMDRMLKEKGG